MKDKKTTPRQPPFLTKCVGCGDALISTQAAALGIGRHGFGCICHPCRDRSRPDEERAA